MCDELGGRTDVAIDDDTPWVHYSSVECEGSPRELVSVVSAVGSS